MRYSECLINIQAGTYAVMLAESPTNEDVNIKVITAMSLRQLPSTHRMDFKVEPDSSMVSEVS